MSTRQIDVSSTLGLGRKRSEEVAVMSRPALALIIAMALVSREGIRCPRHVAMATPQALAPSRYPLAVASPPYCQAVSPHPEASCGPRTRLA
jgi:hypothetical protein